MTNVAQRSFSLGEVSPKLHARSDLARYSEGLRTLRNAIVTKEGGAQSRGGTLYCGAAKNATATLIPCVFSSTQNYVLEFGNLYVRFWLAGVQVTVSGVAAWADATPYVVGDIKSYSGTNYYCHVAHTSATADNRPGTGTTWATKWAALTGAILELPTPYTTADLSSLSVVHADATTMFVAHPSYPMRELVRTAATTWTFAATVYAAADEVDAPANLSVTGAVGLAATYTNYQVTAFVGTLESPVSNTDGWNKRPFPTSISNKTPITLTWDAVSGADGYRIYRSYSGAAYQYVATVTGALTYLDEGTPGTTRTPPSEVNAVTDFTVAGQYPGVIATYQQRLIVSGQTNYPDFVYASRTGNFRNFFPHFPLQDDDAISWRQVGSRLNRITNIAEVARRLVVWSEVGEGVVSGDVDGILRPGEVNPQMMSFNGATVTMDPLLLNDTALYVQARGGIVRDLRPQDGVGSDLSATASHLVNGYTLTDAAYQQTPNSVAWFVRNDGALLSLTYSQETGVFAWARHDTVNGLVISVVCVPESDEDVLYLLVTRTNGTFLERMSNRDSSDPSIRLHMDSALTTISDVPLVESDPAPLTTAAVAPAYYGLAVVVGTPDRLQLDTGASADHAVWYEELPFTSMTSRYDFAAFLENSELRHVAISLVLSGLSGTAGLLFDADTGAYTVVNSALAEVVSLVVAVNGSGWDVSFSVQRIAGTDATFPPNASTTATLIVGLEQTSGGGTIWTGTIGHGVFYEVTTNECFDDAPARLSGLSHLNGESVAVAVYSDPDYVVLASPTDSPSALRVVVAGTVDLTTAEWEDWSGETFVVGLPITVDIETLDIDRGRSSTKRGTYLLQELGVWLEDSLGFWAGPQEPTTATGLTMPGGGSLQPLALVDDDENATTDPITGYRSLAVEAHHSPTGRMFIRNVDPTPLTVLAIVPHGTFPR